MRIIAGKYKGRRLFVPAGLKIRPTSDRVKEAIFNILSPYLSEALVLDLYAGTGNLGIEALSRGAKRAVFVDKHPLAIQTIKRNLFILGIKDEALVYKRDILKGLSFLKEQYQLIFMDPPYEKGYIEKTLAYLFPFLAKDGIIIIEHSPKEKFSLKGFFLIDRRQYGQTEVSFLKLLL
jgi:16S rRNA (guanine966-N2)-methyltransferase